MFKDYTLQTTWGRALVALVVGAVVGSVLSAVFEAVLLTRSGGLSDYWSIDFLAFRTLSNMKIASLFLTIFGAPIWFVIHTGGFRTWMSMLLLGVALPSFWLAYLINTNPTINRTWNDAESWRQYSFDIALYLTVIPLIGALTALTIWRIAYRRPAPC